MSTSKYALLGWPVKHSVSPQMQGAGFAALGIDATYELIETPPDELPNTIRRLRDEGYAGWNITVPHKEHIAPHLDEVDQPALIANSVNTVVNRGGHLSGYSTDGYGIEMALRESLGLDVVGKTIVFIGTGGAARAVAVHLAACGVRRLVLANRTFSKAESVAASVTRIAPACEAVCYALDDIAAVRDELVSAHALIQSTSLGLHAGDPPPVPLEIIPPSVAVMDMIYRRTPLLDAAAAKGCKTADGRGMLLHQGALSFRLWTGHEAPVEAMRAGLDRALAARGV